LATCKQFTDFKQKTAEITISPALQNQPHHVRPLSLQNICGACISNLLMGLFHYSSCLTELEMISGESVIPLDLMQFLLPVIYIRSFCRGADLPAVPRVSFICSFVSSHPMPTHTPVSLGSLHVRPHPCSSRATLPFVVPTEWKRSICHPLNGNNCMVATPTVLQSD